MIKEIYTKTNNEEVCSVEYMDNGFFRFSFCDKEYERKFLDYTKIKSEKSQTYVINTKYYTLLRRSLDRVGLYVKKTDTEKFDYIVDFYSKTTQLNKEEIKNLVNSLEYNDLTEMYQIVLKKSARLGN